MGKHSGSCFRVFAAAQPLVDGTLSASRPACFCFGKLLQPLWINTVMEFAVFAFDLIEISCRKNHRSTPAYAAAGFGFSG
jgi:hypothetical protein